MKRRSFLAVFGWMLAVHCGGVGSGVANPPTDAASFKTAGAAISALFNTNSESNAALTALKALTVLKAAQSCANDPGCTCSSFSQEEQDASQASITVAAYGTPGVYGAGDTNITVAAEHFCTLQSGTANGGNGPDNIGRVAAFTLITDVPANCVDADGTASTVAMKAGSSGVYRNTDTTVTSVAYFPQVYGTFILSTDDGTEETVHCTIFLSEQAAVLFASCSDASGAAVSMDSNAACTINPE